MFLLQTFFQIQKYKFGAFQRRIGRHRVTPSHDFRHLYISPIKRQKTFSNVVKTCPGRIARSYTF